MRYSRLVIGVLAICAAIWVIVSEQLAGASADAVVNAQVVTVRTPIAGMIKDFDRALGDAVAAGDVLGIVTDDRVDALRLDDLMLQRDLVQIRLDLLRNRVAILEKVRADLSSRTEAYAEHSLQDLQVRLLEAEERLRLLSLPERKGDTIPLSYAREEMGRVQVMIAAAEKRCIYSGQLQRCPLYRADRDHPCDRCDAACRRDRGRHA